MTPHLHHQNHLDQHAHDHEAGLADLLDLDADVLGSSLDEVTAWAQRHAPDVVRTVVDVGAGTGTGSLALARRFPTAEVVAIDRSAAMLERLRAAALPDGPADRLLVVQADLDVAWPDVATVDVAWASSSMHEVADPDRLFRDIRAALNPGGLLVVVEMDSLPRFLPDDVGRGRTGLEARCHEAVARLGWNAYPDWGPHLEQAGLELAARRSFTTEASPAPPSAGRYAHAYLSRIRSALDGRLAGDDLDTLDRLLGDAPDALLHRRDLTVRGSRTAWAARR